MRPSKLFLIPALAGAVALGACGAEEGTDEGFGAVEEGLGEGIGMVEEDTSLMEAGVGEGVGVLDDPGIEADTGEFNPALDVNGNGVLDPDEGLNDEDGDGILDRDEEWRL